MTMVESAAPAKAVEELGAQIGLLVLASKKQDEVASEGLRAWQVLTDALETMGIDWRELLVSGPPEVDEDASDETGGDGVTTDTFDLDDDVQSSHTSQAEGADQDRGG